MSSAIGMVAVAMLQLHDGADRLARASNAIGDAASKAADIVVFPYNWVVDGDFDTYAQLAQTHHIAVAVSGSSAGSNPDSVDEVHFKLYTHDGNTLLSHSAPKGTESVPVCGKSGNKSTAILTTQSGNTVRVGLMMGTDYMCMGPARVQMVRGTELLLNPVAVAAKLNPNPSGREAGGSNAEFFQALMQDNAMFYATVNYARVGDTPAGGSFGGKNGAQYMSNSTNDDVLLMQVNVSDIRIGRLTAGTWSGGMDFLSRKPFQYQPLCYEDAAIEHAKAGVPRVRATVNDGPIVKVALLQMNALQVVPGVNPVPAHLQRAEQFVNIAKQKGADVVVFPEQWSVGYSRNYFKSAFVQDADSWTAVYGSYARWAERKDGVYVATLQALAKKRNIAIAAAYTENVDDTSGPGDRLPPRNSVAVIDRKGQLLQNFAKVHIAWDGTSEPDCEGVTQAGRNFYTTPLELDEDRGNVSVCSFICFDREHPESAALCASGGAELILHPTACRMDIDVVRKVGARAIANGVSIAMANYGNSTDDPAEPWGHSVGVNATGHFVVLAPDYPNEPGLEPGEGVFIAEFDIGAQRRYLASERAKGLTTHPLEPELCRIPLQPAYQQGHYDIGRLWL